MATVLIDNRVMNSGYAYYDLIKEPFAGICALDYYTQRYPKFGRGEWQARIARGLVFLNGDVVLPDRVLRAGDRLEYRRPPWEEPAVPTELPVIFEDEDLLVVNKPACLPVLPGGGFLESTVIRLLRRRSAGWKSVSPIHCLDRGTSGLLLLGKNRETRSALGRALQKHRIVRLYLAVLAGRFAEDQLSVATPIGLEQHPRLGPIHVASASGKPAQTDFRVLDRDELTQTTLVQAAPRSGRTHQIRIHAAVVGYPLAGEAFYVTGGRWDAEAAKRADRFPLSGDCGFRLHAWQVTFVHPRGGSPVHLMCPPPMGFWGSPVAAFA